MPSYGQQKIQVDSKDENKKSILKNSNIKFSPKTFSVPQKDLLIFFRQLAVILQSGVPLAQGIELLAENTKNEKFAVLQFQISSRLSSGEELSNCLKKYPKVFAPITVGLIEAGEAGGILDKVLDRIATLIEQQAKIKSQIQGALVYPVIILVLAVTVSLGLLIFIVPTFDKMFQDMGAELPGLTEFMLTLSRIVTSFQFLIGILHFLVIYSIVKYRVLKTDSSLGNTRLFFVTFRS